MPLNVALALSGLERDQWPGKMRDYIEKVPPPLPVDYTMMVTGGRSPLDSSQSQSSASTDGSSSMSSKNSDFFSLFSAGDSGKSFFSNDTFSTKAFWENFFNCNNSANNSRNNNSINSAPCKDSNNNNIRIGNSSGNSLSGLLSSGNGISTSSFFTSTENSITTSLQRKFSCSSSSSSSSSGIGTGSEISSLSTSPEPTTIVNSLVTSTKSSTECLSGPKILYNGRDLLDLNNTIQDKTWTFQYSEIKEGIESYWNNRSVISRLGNQFPNVPAMVRCTATYDCYFQLPQFE